LYIFHREEHKIKEERDKLFKFGNKIIQKFDKITEEYNKRYKPFISYQIEYNILKKETN